MKRVRMSLIVALTVTVTVGLAALGGVGCGNKSAKEGKPVPSDKLPQEAKEAMLGRSRAR